MRSGQPVTVLLPVRNGMPHLADAVDSVLHQTYANFELLVVDDGSTDATASYLDAIADERLRVIRSGSHGLVAALNEGIAQAQHELIARMDADDVSHQDRLALQVWRLDVQPSLVAVGSCYSIVDEAGRPIAEQHVPCLPSYAERQLYFRDAFAHASMMFRRTAVRDVGGYRDVGPCEDYDLWLRLLAKGEIAGVCAPPLFTYRVVAAGVSKTKAALQDDCRRATRATAMRTRPLRVPSPWQVAAEGHEHVSRATSCRSAGATYLFDHVALARVLTAQRRHADALRCLAGSLLFVLRHPASLVVLPPLAWMTQRLARSPQTTERAAAAAFGRRRR